MVMLLVVPATCGVVPVITNWLAVAGWTVMALVTPVFVSWVIVIVGVSSES